MCWGPSRATLGSPFNRPRLIRRQLRKAGSEHLLLQFMRKPSARSPALGKLQSNVRCRSPAREDGDSSEAREKQEPSSSVQKDLVRRSCHKARG